MKPEINVTPLIDVLLVLLIIFMVVSPLRPSAFKTKVPAEPTEDPAVKVHPDTLVVTLRRDLSIHLNGNERIGHIEDLKDLTARLTGVFAERLNNGNISARMGDTERPFTDQVERTVYIKADRSMNYGSVARLVDAVKLSGAYPISLQIDRLN